MQAKADNDEYQVNRISDRIKDLESERSARIEVINNNREQLRSQVNRIKETIHKVLEGRYYIERKNHNPIQRTRNNNCESLDCHRNDHRSYHRGCYS